MLYVLIILVGTLSRSTSRPAVAEFGDLAACEKAAQWAINQGFDTTAICFPKTTPVTEPEGAR